ncbi:MAG: stage sporulation protein SpoAB [Bacillales bacterium]|nr:stage sporulation protein SpoAB [Bacillales bacterium]
MKLLGVVLIVAATTSFGFYAAHLLSQRSKQLRNIKLALKLFETEILYGHIPLNEAMKRIANQVDKPIALIFNSFAIKLESNDEVDVTRCWESSLKEIWPFTALKKQDYEILKSFGNNIGLHDLITEQKNISLTLSHLEREESEAHSIQQQNERMFKVLGFLLGLLIILLLF